MLTRKQDNRGVRGVLAAMAVTGLLLLAGPAPAGAQPSQSPGHPAQAHEGVLAMPYVGVHSLQGDNGKNYDAGLRAGVMVGGYVLQHFSVNGELTYDRMNPHSVPLLEISQWAGDLALSPLFHLPVGPVELVIGPKLGFWYTSAHVNGPLGQNGDGTAHGWTGGANVGALIPVSSGASLGALLTFQFRDRTSGCATWNNANIESCSNDSNTTNVVAFNVALLF